MVLEPHQFGEEVMPDPVQSRQHKSVPPAFTGGDLSPSMERFLHGSDEKLHEDENRVLPPRRHIPPADLSDEALVPYYNEYMRRKMKRRRKAKK